MVLGNRNDMESMPMDAGTPQLHYASGFLKKDLVVVEKIDFENFSAKNFEFFDNSKFSIFRFLKIFNEYLDFSIFRKFSDFRFFEIFNGFSMKI